MGGEFDRVLVRDEHLTYARYRIGDISTTGAWFMMSPNLTADIQPLNISDMAGTRLSYVWFELLET